MDKTYADQRLFKPNKYHARKVTFQGETFDSKHELDCWLRLRVEEQAGRIRGLRRQVRFELIPAQRTPCGDLFRKCEYVCDFVYERDGRTCAEDAKSPATRTPAYIIKRKLMLRVHGIYVKEV